MRDELDHAIEVPETAKTAETNESRTWPRHREEVVAEPRPYVAADFTPAEFAARTAAVRREMRRRDIDVLLLVSPENIYYLLGLNHQGYFCFTLLVLTRSGSPALLTDRKSVV